MAKNQNEYKAEENWQTDEKTGFPPESREHAAETYMNSLDQKHPELAGELRQVTGAANVNFSQPSWMDPEDNSSRTKLMETFHETMKDMSGDQREAMANSLAETMLHAAKARSYPPQKREGELEPTAYGPNFRAIRSLEKATEGIQETVLRHEQEGMDKVIEKDLRPMARAIKRIEEGDWQKETEWREHAQEMSTKFIMNLEARHPETAAAFSAMSDHNQDVSQAAWLQADGKHAAMEIYKACHEEMDGKLDGTFDGEFEKNRTSRRIVAEAMVYPITIETERHHEEGTLSVPEMRVVQNWTRYQEQEIEKLLAHTSGSEYYEDRYMREAEKVQTLHERIREMSQETLDDIRHIEQTSSMRRRPGGGGAR